MIERGPTIITPKEIKPETIADVLATESGYIELLSDPAIQFDDFQREFLESYDRFQIWLKGRQMGFSFASAARALARSQNLDDYTCIISSYKLDDSKEKIRYAKQIYDSLPDNYKKRKLVENQTSLEFVDKSGRKRSERGSSPKVKALSVVRVRTTYWTSSWTNSRSLGAGIPRYIRQPCQ